MEVIRDKSTMLTIDLVYNYIGDNTWSCLPGYLRAHKGTWDISGFNRDKATLDLVDDKGHLAARCEGFGLADVWGYPFNDTYLKLSSAFHGIWINSYFTSLFYFGTRWIFTKI